MSSHTKSFLKPFNFDAALQLSPMERCKICVAYAERKYQRNGLGWWEDIPMIPPVGANPQELEHWIKVLGFVFPIEYYEFLLQWCYLNIEPSGLSVWGTNYKGVGIGSPWVSLKHRVPYRYLVFGDYWRHADGDQLMFDLNDNAIPVVVYLHELGLIEYFAPSFSLALWRLVHEHD
jgi:hypothetical protein